MKPTLLVVDDKPNMLSLLSKVLRGSARVVTARGVGTALAVLEREQVHTVLCDLRMTDGDGLELLHAIRARWQDVPFILMTAYATVATAVHAMQGGAFDYVTKPFDADVLKDKVERALAQGLTSVEARSSEATRFGPLVGGAPAMLRAYSTIERVAASDAAVLLVGESGTGKALVARVLHQRGGSPEDALSTVDCRVASPAEVEDQLFPARGWPEGTSTAQAAKAAEPAPRRTVVVDAIDTLASADQARLARLLQDRAERCAPGQGTSEARLIAVPRRDLRTLVAGDAFREDLFFLLQACVIHLPPLRERLADVPLLARHFLLGASREPDARPHRFGKEATSAMLAYRWPGNVRELRSAVARAVVAEGGAEIGLSSLPEEIRGSTSFRSSAGEVDLADLSYREAIELSRDETNRRYLESVLRRFGGDVVLAAQHANIERESFYRLLRRARLSAEDYRDGPPKGEGGDE